MNLDQMLERAEMTREDLPESLTGVKEALGVAFGEVATIKEQLANERAGVTFRTVQDHQWAYKANYAAAMMQNRIDALKKHGNILKDKQDKQAAGQRKANKVKRAKNRAMNEVYREYAVERERIKQEAHNARQAEESRIVVKAIVEHVKTLPDDIAEGIMRVIREARENNSE